MIGSAGIPMNSAAINIANTDTSTLTAETLIIILFLSAFIFILFFVVFLYYIFIK